MVQQQFIKYIEYNDDKESVHLGIKTCYCGRIQDGDALIILPFFGLTLLLKRKTRETLQDIISVSAALYLTIEL